MWSLFICLQWNCPLIAVYLETYGCQMNVNDTEIAWSILQKSGYLRTSNLQEVYTFPASPCFLGEIPHVCQFLGGVSGTGYGLVRVSSLEESV